MDNQEIYTITILRNLGEPMSLTIRKKTLLIAVGFVLLLLGILIFSAIDYLILGQQNRNLQIQLESSNKKTSLLFKEITKMDQDRFGQVSSLSADALEETLISQKEVTTDDLTINPDLETNTETLEEGVNILVKKIDVQLSGSRLSFKVQIQNKTLPAMEQGGYISLTLANQDTFPVTFQSVTKGELGEAGFPASYKQGRQYMVKSKQTRRVKTSYKLKNNKEYYTHLMVFIYSYKGTLLSRHTKPLDKKIFFE